MKRFISPRGSFLIGISIAVLVYFYLPMASLVYTGLATPGPKRTVEQFVSSLASHKYDGALLLLSENLYDRVTADELRSLITRIEAHQHGIARVTVVSISEKDTALIVQIQVSLHTGSVHYLEVPVAFENGSWKIVSIEPLWDMTVRKPAVKRLIG